MRLFYTLLFIPLLIAASAQSAQYHYVSIEHLVEQEIGRIVLPKIYQKLGIDITITPLPGKRAQSEAVSGRKDGEIMRIYHYGIENPQTVRVPTPYYYLETMAFIRKGSDVVVNSRQDLANYRLLKIRGVKHTNRITAGFSHVIDVDSTEKMFKMLQNNRADVALTNTLDGEIVLKKMRVDSIVPIDKPLAVLPLYHYLHRSNVQLVDKLDNVIRSLEQSGQLKVMIDDAKAKVVNGTRP